MKTFNEIERKFLVDVSKIDLNKIEKKLKITQGYILRSPEGSARIRMEQRSDLPDKAWLVIKQRVDEQTNTEIVCDLNVEEAITLLENNCSKPIIQKIRHVLYDGKLKWEIDEFAGHKEGLVMAELELQNLSDDEIKNLVIPDWVIREVTGESEYYNVNM